MITKRLKFSLVKPAQRSFNKALAFKRFLGKTNKSSLISISGELMVISPSSPNSEEAVMAVSMGSPEKLSDYNFFG
jgi:hypothetical protein